MVDVGYGRGRVGSESEMGPITFESNHYHYHYIAISSLPFPLHTFWKCNHYHYHDFGNVIHYHYTLFLATHTSTGLAETK